MKDIALQIFAFVGESRKENKFPSAKIIEGMQVTMENPYTLSIEYVCTFSNDFDPYIGYIGEEYWDISGKNTLEVIEMMVEGVLTNWGNGTVNLKLTRIELKTIKESLLMSYFKGLDTMSKINDFGVPENMSAPIMERAKLFASLRDKIIYQTKPSKK